VPESIQESSLIRSKRIAIAITVSLCGRAAAQQMFVAGSAPAVPQTGFHLYSISGSFGYSTLPGTFMYVSDSQRLGPDVAAWSSLTTGYRHDGVRNRFGATYTPSYSGHFTYSGLHSLNQNVAVEFNSKITPHWEVTIAGSADSSAMEQFLFQPSPLAQSLAGSSEPDQLAGVVNSSGASLFTSPAMQAAIYGLRTQSVSANAGVVYRPTTRWMTSLRGHSTLMRPRGGELQEQPAYSAIISRTVSAEGTASIGYMVTPRTQLGVQTSVMETTSRLANYRVVNTAGTLEKKWGHRGFVAADGGVGWMTGLRGTAGGASGTTYTGSATAGLAGYEHSVVIGFSRHVGDYYGFASDGTTSIHGGWNWRQSGRHWGLFANGGRQQLAGSVFGSFTAWQASGGLSRSLGRQATVSWGYVFLKTSLPPASRLEGLDIHAVRMTVSLVPFLRDVPPLVDRLQRQQQGEADER
jgi:hypothetical protein